MTRSRIATAGNIDALRSRFERWIRSKRASRLRQRLFGAMVGRTATLPAATG